jgi:hypothetical protein
MMVAYQNGHIPASNSAFRITPGKSSRYLAFSPSNGLATFRESLLIGMWTKLESYRSTGRYKALLTT